VTVRPVIGRALVAAVTAAIAAVAFTRATADAAGTPVAPSVAAAQRLDTATFAGGCFWCMEPPFDELPGVVATISGYTGGRLANPTYEQVSAGSTGHAEVVLVVFDPSKISYPRLLGVFWKNVDPLTPNAQFCDHGDQYRSAIFYHDEAQRRAADSSLRALGPRFREPIVTQLVPAARFYAAEAYHQDYYKKNPVRFKFYKTSCGRERRLDEVWGKDRKSD
jgi:peptide-methionine (S)-S-oxide reductase